ncbi:MAG: hypothetical protein DYH15_07170 [Nitrosomonas sp. PRO4]|nr:hypothetical protein [Nitrosomonas sp. PRO4]
MVKLAARYRYLILRIRSNLRGSQFEASLLTIGWKNIPVLRRIPHSGFKLQAMAVETAFRRRICNPASRYRRTASKH